MSNTSGNPGKSLSVSFELPFQQFQTKINCGLLSKGNTCYIPNKNFLHPMIKELSSMETGFGKVNT